MSELFLQRQTGSSCTVENLTGHRGGDNSAVLDRHYLDVQAENADQTVTAMLSWLGAQGVKLEFDPRRA